MQKLLLIALLVLFSPDFSRAQYNIDYGVLMGATNYLGEMGGNAGPRRSFIADMKINQTRWATGGYFRYKFHPLITARANLMYLRIQGADSLSSNLARNGRNLQFKNDIFELSTIAEYNFYNANDIARRGSIRLDFGAYAFLGVGVFYHNPKGFDGKKNVALQPLGTEGQGWVEGKEKYNRIQISIPGGVGIYYILKRKWRLGWELSIRKTFTDYLDDASDTYVNPNVFDNSEKGQKALAMTDKSASSKAVSNGEIDKNYYGNNGNIRGNPKQKDFFMHTVFSAGYVVRGKGSFYKSKYNLITGASKKKRKTRAKF